MPFPNSKDRTEYLLRGETQILQSISARAPIARILNEICIALDCQLGNVVSTIIPSESDVTELSTIQSNAKLFGLYTFCSERIVTEGGESLGSLEMYCCVPRGPTACERQVIERSGCLIALAIKLGNGPIHQGSIEIPRLRPVQLRGMDAVPISSWQVN